VIDRIKLFAQHAEYKSGYVLGYYEVMPGEGRFYDWCTSGGSTDVQPKSHILFTAGYLDGRLGGFSRDPSRHDVLIMLLSLGLLSSHLDEHGQIIVSDSIALATSVVSGAGPNLLIGNKQEPAQTDSEVMIRAVQSTMRQSILDDGDSIMLEETLMALGHS
jgi:hypothetical protein